MIDWISCDFHLPVDNKGGLYMDTVLSSYLYFIITNMDKVHKT